MVEANMDPFLCGTTGIDSAERSTMLASCGRLRWGLE
jgi:hypothetical protein